MPNWQIERMDVILSLFLALTFPAVPPAGTFVEGNNKSQSDFVDVRFSHYGHYFFQSAFMCFYPLLPTFLSRRPMKDAFQNPSSSQEPPHLIPSHQVPLYKPFCWAGKKNVKLMREWR